MKLVAASILLVTLASAQDTWLDPRLTPLPSDKLGPFAHTADGKVIAIDGKATFVSSDAGRTWSDPRPLKGALEKGILVSRERASG